MSLVTQDEVVDCFICVEPCRAVCVFSCGHYVCYACGLRVQSLTHNSGCPVCRVKSDEAVVTNTFIPAEEEKYSPEELSLLHCGGDASIQPVKDKTLKCLIDNPFLAMEMQKLYAPLCPFPQCWERGARQEPFVKFNILQEHLRVEHNGMNYCEVCLRSRPAFLCEQLVYNPTALQQHLEGCCPQDSESFTGHPPCKFCKEYHRHQNNNNNNNNAKPNKRFYDGETLLKHMQQDHFTCDICNMGQFTFTFYQNREKLFDHFVRRHKLCDHPDCAKVDPMLRVFKHDLDLGLHKQKVHGIKLKSLEFTDLGGLTESEVNNYNLYGSLPVGGNHHNNGNSNVPATAANMNVIYIIFDFIYRTEKVEMLPTQSNQNNKSKNKNKNHKNNKNNNNNKTEGGKEEASVALVPKSNGLPPHYFEEVHFPIMKRKTTKDENNENEKSENEDSMKRNSSAFRIAENYQTYQRNNNIPTDVEEQKSQLQQLLRKNIPNPSQLNEFKMRTKDFMDGKLLTVHYYEMLSQHFFKHNRPALESVYPLLVATVPDEQKKTALREVWKMKCAPEYQRQEKVKEEERVKQEEAALWESLKAGNNNNNNNSKNNKKGNNNNNGNNPWAKRTKITIVKNAWQDEKNKEKEKPEPPTTSITQRWGTGVNNHNNNSYHDPFPSFADEAAREELFPSLPSTRPNNNNNKLKPGGKKNKPNAWFKK